MTQWAKDVLIYGWKGIREEYKKLNDIPEGYLPKYIFVEGELDPMGGGDIEIEWVD